MPQTITELNVKIGADLKSFDKEMKSIDAKMKKLGKGLTSFGKKMSVGLTAPLAAFAAKSLQLFNVQAQAEQQLKVALGGREDIQKRLIKQARELQGETLFGDEETIRAQALIAAFVDEEEAIRTIIPLVQDMAQAKGMDLAGAADLVSKTLGSSTNAMSRYGIEVTGNVGSTERLATLTEGLERAFGGTASAAADAGTGGIIQLKNSIGDLSEQFGGIINERLKPLVERIKGVVNWFDNLTDENKELIVTVAGITAVIGPLTLAIGFLMTTLSPWAVLVGAVIAAGTALVMNWDTIKAWIDSKVPGMTDIFVNGFTRIKDIVVIVFNLVVDTIKNGLTIVSNIFGVFINLFTGDWSGAWQNIKNITGALWDNIKNVVRAAIDSLIAMLPGFVQEWLGIKDDIGTATDGIETSLSDLDKAHVDSQKEFGETETSATDMKAALDALVTPLGEVETGLVDASTAAGNAEADMSSFNTEITKVDSTPVETLGTALSDASDTLVELPGQFTDATPPADFGSEVTTTLSGWGGLVDTFKTSITGELIPSLTGDLLNAVGGLIPGFDHIEGVLDRMPALADAVKKKIDNLMGSLIDSLIDVGKQILGIGTNTSAVGAGAASGVGGAGAGATGAGAGAGGGAGAGAAALLGPIGAVVLTGFMISEMIKGGREFTEEELQAIRDQIQATGGGFVDIGGLGDTGLDFGFLNNGFGDLGGVAGRANPPIINVNIDGETMASAVVPHIPGVVELNVSGI